LANKDGSAGCISYFAVGDKDFSKERIEIFGDEKVCIIDDYRELTFSQQGKGNRIRKAQDKGHRNEIIEFFDAILNGKPSPILFEKIVETTKATFAIHKSLSSRMVVAV